MRERVIGFLKGGAARLPAALPLLYLAGTEVARLYTPGATEEDANTIKTQLGLALAFSMFCEGMTRATKAVKGVLESDMFGVDVDDENSNRAANTNAAQQHTTLNPTALSVELGLTGGTAVLASFMLATPGPILTVAAPYAIATAYLLSQIASSFTVRASSLDAQSLVTRSANNDNAGYPRLAAFLASLPGAMASLGVPLGTALLVERLGDMLQNENYKNMAPHIADGILMAFSTIVAGLTLLNASGNLISKRSVDVLRSMLLSQIVGLCALITEFGHGSTSLSRFITPLVGYVFCTLSTIIAANSNALTLTLNQQRQQFQQQQVGENSHAQEIAVVEGISQGMNILGQAGLLLAPSAVLAAQAFRNSGPLGVAARKALEGVAIVNLADSVTMFGFDRDMQSKLFLFLALQALTTALPLPNLISNPGVANAFDVTMCLLSALFNAAFKENFASRGRAPAQLSDADRRNIAVRFLEEHAYRGQLPVVGRVVRQSGQQEEASSPSYT